MAKVLLSITYYHYLLGWLYLAPSLKNGGILEGFLRALPGYGTTQHAKGQAQGYARKNNPRVLPFHSVDPRIPEFLQNGTRAVRD